MSRQTIVVTSAFTFSLLALLGSPAAAQDDPVAQLRAELEQQQAEMARLKQMVANMAGSGSAVGAGTIAVIDLNTVMKALGRDREVQFQLQTEQKLISEELKDRQSKIRTHLETESQKVAASETSDQEKKQKMELLQRKLQQIWQQEMQKARKDINDYRGSLNKAFLAQLLPFAKSSAQELGASVVAARTDLFLHYESAIDITQSVSQAMKDAGLESAPIPDSAFGDGGGNASTKGGANNSMSDSSNTNASDDAGATSQPASQPAW
ncbi:MAG: OmpH family outer membrane protein [Phycisphaeraceae bacterium]|nr:OmpH family outer membrane protein [Phycisphaeraceae bacterium]MDP7347836.1 OmpH family outer membrane protein [Phycisphaeraceae bacterium]